MSLEILRQVYNALDPFEPASGSYYLDCSPARGGDVFLQDLTSHLKVADDYICTLFTGHIGTGKSSELAHVRRELSNKEIGGRRYFPVLVDAQKYLDEFDTDTIDIFLAMVTELAATLTAETGLVLADSWFTRKLRDLKGLFLTELELKDAQINLFGNKVKMGAIKQDPDVRTAVRNALGSQPTTLFQAVNDIFDETRERLRKLPGEEPAR